MEYKTQFLKDNGYFILYDQNDNIKRFFENYKELENYFKKPLWDFTRYFKKNNGKMEIQTQKELLKLYAFCDN